MVCFQRISRNLAFSIKNPKHYFSMEKEKAAVDQQEPLKTGSV